MFLFEAISDFLLEQRFRGNSKATVSDYQTKLSKFQVYADFGFEISDLNLTFIRSYYYYLSNTLDNSITIQSYVRALRAFLNWLYSKELINDDLCSRFKLPKARKPYINVLSDSEIITLYNCYSDYSNSLHTRNKVILSLMLDCGLRLDEVVTLERSNLHLIDRYIIVTGKGNKQRCVRFGDTTFRFLSTYLKQFPRGQPLLYCSDGSPLTQSSIKNMFRRLKKQSDIERLHPHLLRHTFATKFLESGGDIYTLKDLLGHTTLKQTQQYLHIAKTRIIPDYERYSPLDNIKKANP